MNSMITGVVAYVLIQFLVGMWVSRRVKTQADFIIAGRSLGLTLVSFSVFATFFGAEAIVGTGGSVYEKGLAGGRSDPFGYAIAMLIFGALFAAPLWQRGLVTFGDLFRQRYSPAVEKLVVLVLLPGSIFWAAAQIRAFGQIVSAASGVNVTFAIMLAAVVVVAYSVLGGLLADAWTDLVQGLAVIVGLLVLAAAVAGALGGFGASLANVPADRLQALSLGEGGVIGFIDGLAIPICGTIVAVELISRALGARSADIGARGAIIGGLIYFAVALLPLYIGLVGPQLIASLDEPEQLVPRLAEAHLPGLLYVLFVGAVISAILSTVDTVLLASAAQVSRNLLEPVRPGLDDAGRLLQTRLALLALAVVAFAIAFGAERIKDLVETASAAGSAGVFVVLLFALFTNRGGSQAAIATMIVGALGWLAFRVLLDGEGAYTAALAASFVTYLAVSAATKK